MSLTVREVPRAGGRALGAARRALPGGTSAWWLIAAAGAFALAQLLFVSVRMGLSWDEAVYVSQVSGHAPAAYFDPARARGVTLLVAPVTLLTSSFVALRIYLSFVSGLGLLAALWAWRPLRAAWVLGLAGVAFGGLWVAQYYGPQAMPDMWSALSGLFAVGCFLRYVSASAPVAGGGRRALAGLAGGLGCTALFRPGDAVYLAVPLFVAAGVVAAWRRWELVVAMVAGLAAGGAEWVIEAYVRFGGVGARLHAAGAEQSGFGLHFAVLDELKAVNGPTLCRPCTVGLRYPEASLWWLALPVLEVLGVLAARRLGQLGSSLLPLVCGCCAAAQYLFMINYAAPRFLLPAYALLAIPVADGLAWMVSGLRWDLRPAMTAVVVCFLVVQLVIQHLVLDHEVGGTVAFHDDYTRIAAELVSLGVRPPCLVNGDQYIPVGYYAGCASAPSLSGSSAAASGEKRILLVPAGHRPPGYARGWRAYRLRGTTVLKLVAYLPPA
jgi:hypothetical protein